jgi:Arc/MetJ family transcription regulator
VGTAPTWIEIDEEALALSGEVLGTRTATQTVNAALREVARLRQFREEAGEGGGAMPEPVRGAVRRSR